MRIRVDKKALTRSDIRASQVPAADDDSVVEVQMGSDGQTSNDTLIPVNDESSDNEEESDDENNHIETEVLEK